LVRLDDGSPDTEEEFMKRRDFLKKAGVAGAAAAAASVVNAPYVHAQGKKVRWKMVTTWPPKLPFLQTGVVRFAKRVEELSGGNFKIRVYAGGELVPPFGSFDAVSKGTVEGRFRRGLLLGRQRARLPVVRRGALWHERPADGLLALGRQRPQALGGSRRGLQPGTPSHRLHRRADGRLVQQTDQLHRRLSRA
jgi:hypothetical protein